MLQGEHSAILSTFIKLPFVNKIFVLSIFVWPLKTGFTVKAKLGTYLGREVVKLGKEINHLFPFSNTFKKAKCRL